MTLPRSFLPFAVAIATQIVGPACTQDENDGRIEGAYGSMCPEENCMVDLVCSRDGHCRRPGDPGAVKEGRACSKDGQCLAGLICGSDGKCHSDEGATEGEACGDGANCREDYVCAADGTCKPPGEAGTGGEGFACEGEDDCAANFSCGQNGKCIQDSGPSEGEACRAGETPCREDLVCGGDDTCKAPGEPGTTQAGEACQGDNACQRPLACSVDGVCSDPTLGGAVGAPCLPEDLFAQVQVLVPPGVPAPPGPCKPELACAFSGNTLEIAGNPVVIDGIAVPVGECRAPGEPGTAGFGDACADISECRVGYACLFDKCIRPVQWEGAQCLADDGPEDPPVAYFRVPRAGEPLAEFFQLPFPNDARLGDDGLVDISGFPEPSAVIPDETVKRYVTGVDGKRGFGLAGRNFFRFSSQPDIESLRNQDGEAPRLYIVDIDPESPSFGERVGMRWQYDSRRGKYICRNHMEIMPMPNAVLRPGTTYAGLVMDRVRHMDGGKFARDPDFEAMMREAVPDDADLARAHGHYDKLRDWLDAEDTPARSEVLVAAVFTTDDPTVTMGRFREVVRSLEAPTAAGLTRCGGGAASPCPAQAGTTGRGCPAAEDDGFHELHGTFSAPVFQKGTKPFLTADAGGAIELDGEGRPIVQGREEICFALTVPKNAPMPPGGWPLVLYGHGTGGSFRTFVYNGVAADLSAIDVGVGEDAGDGGEGGEGEGEAFVDDGTQRFAVLSIDGPMHGPRRGSDASPDDLFFNVLNPVAARDNSVQAAADLFVTAQMSEALDVAAGDSPIGEAIRFDRAKTFYVGHSQGGNAGALSVPFEERVHSAVLSGTGGGLLLSLLDKRSPVDLSAGVQLVMAETDPDFELNQFHPVLSMVQWYVDAADPGSYARWWFREPKREVPPHLFMTFGLEDTYTPPRAMHHFARALGVHITGRVYDEGHRLFVRELPVKRNKPAGETARVTAALQQFQPDGYDGHFVLFRDDEARRKYRWFLATAARDGIPTLVE